MSFPLSLQQAKRYIGQRVALAGDAAHGVHPMAGQGLNMGFIDAQILSKKLVENIRQGIDFGYSGTLEDYEAESKFANYSMAATIEAVVRLYHGSDPLKGAIRNLGSVLTNGSPLAKIFTMGANGNFFIS